MKNVIITGADGFVGSYTVKYFIENSCKVLALDMSEGATAKELESRPVTSATQALQGLVPGLQISTSTGELDKTCLLYTS